MSTNGVNVEDADMAECDGEKVVTMMDVLQEQQEFEEDANAVLGASDDKNCTYNKGYIKRQALYACLTCCADAKEEPSKRAGVCLACSLACHENHDLVELYTKRNFRCDCGNPKFTQPCTYTQNKTQLNDDNSYNQNFSGLYCICHRPYPDPEGIEEEMIQCIICEDWLHASHLEATIPSSDLYAEMVCKACMDKNDFLHDYSEYAVNGDIDVVNIDENDKSVGCNGDTKMNGADVEEGKDINDSEVNCEEKAQNNTVSMEAMDDTLTDNDNIITDNKEPNASTIENGDKPGQIEEKPNTESETKTSAIDEPVIDETVNDDQNSISNTDQEIVKANTDMLPETKDDTTTDKNAITPNTNTLNIVDVNSKTDSVEHFLEDKMDESSSGVPLKTISADDDDNAVENMAAILTNSNEVEDINTEINETESKIDGEPEIKTESETKTEESETKIDESELKTEKSKTNTDELESKTDEPVSKTDEPESKTDELDSKTDEPESKTDEPETKTDELESKKDEPESKTDEPESKTDELESKTDEPISEISETDTNTEIEKGIKDEHLSSDVTPKEHEDSVGLNDNSSAAKEDIEMNESSNMCNIEVIKDQSKEHKRKLSTDEIDDISVKKPKLEKAKCSRPKRGKWFKGATFWPSHFRQKLCTCSECITMYKDLAVLFLIDPDDTVTAYETLGKERTDGTSSTSSYEKGLEALSSLDRIQQINALTEYNKMRDKLLDFLKSFKDRREVVKEEDIKAFFAGMKPKREPDGVYFCR